MKVLGVTQRRFVSIATPEGVVSMSNKQFEAVMQNSNLVDPDEEITGLHRASLEEEGASFTGDLEPHRAGDTVIDVMTGNPITDADGNELKYKFAGFRLKKNSIGTARFSVPFGVRVQLRKIGKVRKGGVQVAEDVEP